MKALFLSFIALTSLSLNACSDHIPDENEETVIDLGPAPADLNGGALKGTRWRLISMGPAFSEQSIIEDPQHPAFIEFDKTDQRIAGSTGCNRFFGKYRLIDTAGFTVGQFGMTRIACDGPQADQDLKIVKQIEQAHFYGINNQRLTIASIEDQRLIFVPMAADVVTKYRCDQGRLLNTSLSALTGHLALQLPDGAVEDLPAESISSYANGLYRLTMMGDKIAIDDLTLHQRMKCERLH